MPPSKHLWVNGVVAQRDGQPYIQLSNEDGIYAQLDIAAARQVAADITQMAARTEADAMLFQFFKKMEFPEAALGALLTEFRDYRAELDKTEVERPR